MKSSLAEASRRSRKVGGCDPAPDAPAPGRRPSLRGVRARSTTAIAPPYPQGARETGFQTHIAHRSDQVIVIQHHRGETALEQVPGPAPASVDEVGIATMRFADSQPKRIRMCGDQDEMNVVGHQAIRPTPQLGAWPFAHGAGQGRWRDPRPRRRSPRAGYRAG